MIVFISADDESAKKRVETLLESFGYSVIDLGNLRDGGLNPTSTRFANLKRARPMRLVECR